MDEIRTNLKNIARAILIIGCVVSFIVGIVIFAVAYEGRKIFGLVAWTVGPCISLLFSIIILGVSIKDEELEASNKKNELLESNNKKLDKIYGLLLRMVKEDEKAVSDTKSSKDNQKDIILAAKEISNINNNEANIKEEVKNVFDSFSFSYSVNSSTDVKVEDDNLNEEENNEDSYIKTTNTETEVEADYMCNINDCVLYKNVLTLPNGKTLYLEKSSNIKLLGTMIAFVNGDETYVLEMNDKNNALDLTKKLNTKEF